MPTTCLESTSRWSAPLIPTTQRQTTLEDATSGCKHRAGGAVSLTHWVSYGVIQSDSNDNTASDDGNKSGLTDVDANSNKDMNACTQMISDLLSCSLTNIILLMLHCCQKLPPLPLVSLVLFHKITVIQLFDRFVIQFEDAVDACHSSSTKAQDCLTSNPWEELDQYLVAPLEDVKNIVG